MTVIQWFPGHMAKALRLVKEKLSLVDIVLELVDARLPESSRNPQLEQLLATKPHVMVLTKKDMADPNVTARWLHYYESKGIPAVAVDSQHGQLNAIEKKINVVLKDKLALRESKGIIQQRVKVMCIGIPNVGKSTLLNHLVNKNVAITGNRPGVTKAQQWLKAGKSMSLLDTPGILWPKFEDQKIGQRLALTGAIKDSLYSKDDIALYGLEHFKQTNPKALQEKYKLTDEQMAMSDVDLLLALTKKMGFKEDYDRASERVIFDIRQGKLGRYTLEIPQLGGE
ncbi:ribosome biogenesis GTPase YlqF [Dellaglioa sp. BT-FLS60]